MPRTCWAASRGDCAGKLSLEHVFSPKLWRSSGVLHGGKSVAAFGGRDRGSPKDLQARVLCQRHNSMLAELDREAIDLQTATYHWVHPSERRDQGVLVDGWLLERWVMKCTCGFFASGWNQPGVPASERDTLTIGAETLAAIFGERRLEPPRGLYVVTHPPLTVDGPGDHVYWEPIWFENEPAKIVGLVVRLNAIAMICIPFAEPDVAGKLRRRSSENSHIDWRVVQVRHRPTSIRLDRLRIELAW
jgi:hypothetical protein